MFDSIQLALSGMLGYQRGLSVISNNVANMNTPGFRGSSVDFVDVFSGSPGNGLPDDQARGNGVDSSGTLLDATFGLRQTTGRDLDLFLQGAGYFVVTDENGDIRYTRNGSFEFGADNELVIRNQKIKVMALGANGELTPISIRNLQLNAAKPTTEISFKDNLSPTDPDKTLDGVTVIDASGGTHSLRIVFAKDTTVPATGNIVSWNVSVLEGGSPVGSGRLQFIGPTLMPGTSPVSVTLGLHNAQPLDLSLNFDGVTGNATGASVPPGSGDPTTRNSSLSVLKQNGFAAGTLSSEKFDEKGVLKLTYTNGQTVDGPKLALANVRDDGGLVELDNSLLEYQGPNSVQLREAADDLKVQGQALEGSNVDLTSEFSKIILMQRGYQAASEVVSTANEMVQQLLDMRGGR